MTTAMVLAYVLAGGEGRRLAPLTRLVAKPAVPFHVNHRLIDFALSNLCNSGIATVKVLTQYQPRSVLQHLTSAWGTTGPGAGLSIEAITGGEGGMPRSAGTAHAVYLARRQILEFRPDVVAVFGADHVYRMDVRQMIDFHLQSGGDATVAALPVPLAQARSFGVIDAGVDGRIRGFAEKPQQPRPMPGLADHALASMGNYLFSPQALLGALQDTHAAAGTDFGSDLLPLMAGSSRLLAYDFTTNRIAGLPAGGDRHYWRDVGTIDAYFAAHMDTLAPGDGVPTFHLHAESWPIFGPRPASAPGRETARRQAGCVEPLATADAVSIAASAEVSQSVLRQGVTIRERAQVLRCIVGENVEVGARCLLRNVIIEPDNILPDGIEIGIDPVRDARWLPVSAGGVAVVRRGSFGRSQATVRSLIRFPALDAQTPSGLIMPHALPMVPQALPMVPQARPARVSQPVARPDPGAACRPSPVSCVDDVPPRPPR